MENTSGEVGLVDQRRDYTFEYDDPACFSMTILIVLLYKYSSRLFDEVSLILQIPETASTQKLKLGYSLDGEQTFYSVFKRVRQDLETAFDEITNQSLDIEWAANGNSIDLKYRVRLIPTSPGKAYNAVFSSDPHSFFHFPFKKATRHYKKLAKSAMMTPYMPIGDLDYCSTQDESEIESVAYGQIDERISAPEFLDQLFEKTVDEHPQMLAVTYHNQSVTYLGLSQQVNRLVSLLKKNNVGRGKVVGILLHRSIEAYAAIIAIMKCGAAYVPIDPDYPGERVKYILEDSFAKLLISDSTFKRNYLQYTGTILHTDLELRHVFSEWSNEDAEAAEPFERSTTDPAYIIYTSGSTGKPKGVVISHSAASNLIKAEKSIFKVHPGDKVGQGFSLAFDASIEEIWLAFSSGASLYPIDKEIMCSGADVSSFISKEKITVFSTVPSLLSMMEPHLPSLRLLILGGEACSHVLLKNWSNEKLRIVNTYGPTEATVIATTADYKPGKEVTIGKPIANCSIFITDSSVKPVPLGVPGELCIGGFGLANGYQNNANLTAEKFVVPPFHLHKHFPRKIYRSGDLARINEEGEIEFVGRIDNQVKLRGYRIELTEIESQIQRAENIKNVVVALKQDSVKGDFLVAYIILEDKSQFFNVPRMKEHLRKKLASYMIPALFVELDEFPLLPSGKIDRKKIGSINIDSIKKKEEPDELLNETEQQIHHVWKKYFSPHTVSKKDDFFLDLGGHSMLAAKTVSELRLHSKFQKLSVLDVYKNPSIEKLARQFTGSDNKNGKPHRSKPLSQKENHANSIRHLFCGILQFFSFYFVFGFNLIRDLSLYAVFFYLYYNGHTLESAIAWGLISSIVSYPLTILLAVAVKWILLGRIKAGRYRLWSGFYLRWWFVRKLFQILDLYHLAGTPLLPVVYRALGMKIGKEIHLETDHFAAFDLITIGDGTSIDEEATLNGFSVCNGFLTIGPITIGSNCFVGTRSVVCENTVMKKGARLEDLSLLTPGTTIPDGETWSGSPARCTSKMNCTEVVTPPKFSKLHKPLVSIMYCVLVSLLPIVSAIAFVPGVFLLMQFDPLKEFWVYLSLLPVVGASFVILLTMEVAFFKWVFLRKAKPGVYPVHGSFYFKHWIVDQLLRLSLDYVGQLHATLYVTSWYRMLGMKIGSMVELSTAASTTPDLVQLDEGCTIADEVSLGSPHIEKGWMILSSVHMGRRSFAGNSAVIPAGVKIGDYSLVGVLSIAPKREDAEHPNTTWFGSPPILFPRRESSDNYAEEKTYNPPAKLRFMRAAFELLRITMPPAASIIVMSSLITTGLLLFKNYGALPTALALPLIFFSCSSIMVLLVAGIKWIVIGKYQPFTRPLWTNFVWRLEFVNALYEFFSSPLLLQLLQGTPFLAWFLRLMGAKIGKECYIDSTGFLEWDLVHVGDRVIINEDAVMQTHLFEDRVLKASHLFVGNDCTIGSTSVVLYDSEMKDGAQLHSLSLLMKGEILPEQTHWVGIPAIESETWNTKSFNDEVRTNKPQYEYKAIAQES